jgi:hypothetical protein
MDGCVVYEMFGDLRDRMQVACVEKSVLHKQFRAYEEGAARKGRGARIR